MDVHTEQWRSSWMFTLSDGGQSGGECKDYTAYHKPNTIGVCSQWPAAGLIRMLNFVSGGL